MRKLEPRHSARRGRFAFALLTGGALAASLMLPQAAFAQVAALVNGAPITELDIAQRTKLNQVGGGKVVTRKAVLEELITDQLKITVGKRYGQEISTAEIDSAIASMAQRSHLSVQQFEQSMTARGVPPATLRLRIKADIGWAQMVRSRYNSSLQVNDADIRNAMHTGAESDKKEDNSGFTYTIYPITLVAPRGSSDAAARAHEAENLRSRFQSCADGIKLVRTLRDVVVREPVTRNSADLAPQLREVLDKMDIGKLTAPELTAQGIQMFALCDRKENNSDTPARRAAREDVFQKKFMAESKKFLNEIRRQSMIEYR